MNLWNKLVQFGQTLGGGAKIENKLNVPEPFLELVSKFVEPMADADAGLTLDVLRYIFDGVDEETTLNRMATNEQAKQKFGFDTSHRLTSGPFQLILKEKTKCPPEFWVRFAKFIDAATKGTNYYSANSPACPRWLKVLLESRNTYYQAFGPQGSVISCQIEPWLALEMEEILKAGDLPADLILDALVRGTIIGWQVYVRLREPAPYVEKFIDKVRGIVLGAKDNEELSRTLKNLADFEVNAGAMADVLVRHAVTGVKAVREPAARLLAKCPDSARPHLDRILEEGDAGERYEAASLYWQLYCDSCNEVFQRLLEKEKSSKVKKLMQTLMSSKASISVSASQIDEELKLPPLELKLGEVPLPSETKDDIRNLLLQISEVNEANYKILLTNWEKSQDKALAAHRRPTKPNLYSAEEIEDLIVFVETGVGNERKAPYGNDFAIFSKSVSEFAASSNLELIHLLRLIFWLGLVTTYGWSGETFIEKYRERCSVPFGLRELDHCFATLPGLKAGHIANIYLNNYDWRSSFDWEPSAVWPLFLERMEDLARLVSTSIHRDANDYSFPERRLNALKVLAMFPKLPEQFVGNLWLLALGGSKQERLAAQKALAKVPNQTERIIEALGDGKQEVRITAAEWLARLGDKAALEALRKAFHKEKSELAKGALIHALDALGADVNEFLDRDKLEKEASAGLAKKKPSNMDWINLGALPKLHWKDNGAEVSPLITQWWVVQTVQQKNPVCTPLLKRYLALCKPNESANFARHILGLWLNRDAETIPPELAAYRAAAEADRLWAQYANEPYFLDSYKNDKKNLEREIFTNLMRTPLQSAINEKGMLAIVTAAGDAECAKQCEKYIREWYGQKAAHCRALIEVLAWMDNPLALQILLSIANRFRTKSIKEAAQEHVTAIADRRGWTIDELADRTIPDGGFERPLDENGEPCDTDAVLEIDYGPRQFIVKLNDQLEPVITLKGDEKEIKNLPEPGKSDDPQLAAAGKKSLSECKKTVKAVVKLQTERLYEALCTQRAWQLDDWRLYLAQHPIVGRLCIRLVWAAFSPSKKDKEEETFIGCIRPMEDGSLTNEKDEAVELPEDTILRLAHVSNVPEELGKAWLRHLQDYDVTPLFAQFDRPLYTLPPEKAKQNSIDDFVGYTISTFKLRSKATKLGYVRGDTEDGGWYFSYRKDFTALAIQVVLKFTGSCLPEREQPAALEEMYFVQLRKQGGMEARFAEGGFPLSKVPPVLLSECYNDIRQIAAEGGGFDPKWKEQDYLR